MHGAVFSNRKSYCPVRCGFMKAEILRCGSVRFSDIVNPTVRFGAVICPTVRLGAVLKIRNPTVRFGAVFRYSKSHGAVRCRDKSYGAVRCGSPLNGSCYGAGPIPVRKTRIKPCFPMVPRRNKPYKIVVSHAVSYGSLAVSVFTHVQQSFFDYLFYFTGFRINCKLIIYKSADK